MSNVLQIIAEDSDDLLNTGAYGAGAVIRVQWAATSGGTYADISGTGSTPTIALVAGDRTYTAFDPAGTTTTYYRTRFENVGATRASDWSTPFQVAGTADLICTIGQVKARLNPSGSSDTNDDAMLTELVEQVSAWVQGYTGRKLVPEVAQTYTFDTAYGTVLRIPRGVRAITSMGVASTHQPDTGGTYVTVPSTDRILRPLTVELPEGWPPTEVRISRGTRSGTVSTFADADNGCTITGDFGFAATPADVQAVCIDAVVAAYASRKNGASSVLGVDDTALPPWASFFGRGSPQRATLDRYRYVSV